MKLFDVYPLYNINIVKGDGCKVWDENGTEYLDLYAEIQNIFKEFEVQEVMPLSLSDMHTLTIQQ